MQHLFTVSVLVAVSAGLRYPVYSPGNGALETCKGIQCAEVDCKPPFKYRAPKDFGTCCPVCWADSVKVAEDRSWTDKLTGGVGLDNGADQTACRDAMCPKLHCPEFEQYFDGRCCTKCKSSEDVTEADR